MPQETAVLSEIVDGVGIMTLNRPDKFNCISSGLMDAMAVALSEFENNAAARVVLLRGSGKVFCTGADLDELLERRGDPERLKEYIAQIHQILRHIEASPLPVVAAIHGLALAGGIEILLACDVVFAADNARIGDQHGQYGLVPGGGGSQRLARIVGLRRALDLMFTSRWLDATEAERWGLVNYVAPEAELQERTLDYCRGLAKKSRPGLAFMKQITRQGLEGSLDAGLALEEREVAEALMSADTTEGLDAFQARREPNFP